ncbi:MAG: hypothetical protein Fur002_17160 [Anaerolineales bacterium]
MTWFNRVFNIRAKEWTRLLFLAAILIFSNIGTNWGTTAVYGEFLKQSGAGAQSGLQTLIWALMMSALLSVPALSLYTAFVDRVDANRLFIYIIAAGGAVILIGMALLGMGMQALAFPFIYVLSQAWLAIFNPHFFTYVNELFDIQSAKRALPLILAGGRIGAALAGFTLKPLRAAVSMDMLLWMWLASDALVIVALMLMPAMLKKEALREPAPRKSDGRHGSFFSSLKEGLHFTMNSSFLRWMAIGALLLSALINVLEYYANQVLAPLYPSSVDYTGFLGNLDGVSNLIALLTLLFVVNRMTKSWGVANASLTFPFVTLFISGGLAAFPVWLTASLANLNRKGLRFSLYAPIEALLYNAIPLRIKGRARAFVGGLLFPLGAILGVSIPLLLNLFHVESTLPLRGVIAFFSFAFVFAMFMIRRQYAQSLVKMLEEDDYSFLMNDEANEFSAADPAALKRLQTKLEKSASHEMRVFMTQVIAQAGGAEALRILIPAVQSTAEARTRAAMLEVMAAAGLRGDELRELCADFLADEDARLRHSAASALEQMLGAQNEWMQELWTSMVNDPHPQTSLYALKALAQTGKFFSFEPAVWKLDDLFKSASNEDKKNAIEILSLIAEPKSVRQLLEFLVEPNDSLRLEAALSLEKTALPLGMSLDEDILDFAQILLQDPVARIRQAALTILEKYKKKELYPLFFSALADQDAQIRAAAANILAAIGKDVIPLAQAELKSKNEQSRKMAAFVLSRIDARQFGALIEKAVSEDLNRIYQNIGTEEALAAHQAHRSARALLSALRERNRELIDEILYLLSAIHDAQTLRVVGESLHSDSPATRNLALEALESLTSPQTAALIASLFEPLAPAQLLKLSEGALTIQRASALQALQGLSAQREDEVRLLLTLHSMGDIGAEFARGGDAQAEALLVMLKKIEGETFAPIRDAARFAVQKILAAQSPSHPQESRPLSLAEKMIVLKEAPFFRNIPTRNLAAMAEVSQEKTYHAGERIFKTGEPGGALYIIVDGQVKIEQEKREGTTLLATLENDASFGEMSLFDDSPRSASAIAARESSILEVTRAPIIALTAQSPDMALELIAVLSQRIRETSERLADAARARPRELHKLYDQFGA